MTVTVLTHNMPHSLLIHYFVLFSIYYLYTTVSDRMNAQSSCAGQFIGNHLETYLNDAGNRWLHVDMAGPSSDNGRATGFGVALLYQLALNA